MDLRTCKTSGLLSRRLRYARILPLIGAMGRQIWSEGAWQAARPALTGALPMDCRCANIAPTQPQRRCGELPEWSNGAVSKTVEPLGVPRVRIPHSPPSTKLLVQNDKVGRETTAVLRHFGIILVKISGFLSWPFRWYWIGSAMQSAFRSRNSCWSAQGAPCVAQLLRCEMGLLRSCQYRLNNFGRQEGETRCS